jgi:hypothetical protein
MNMNVLYDPYDLVRITDAENTAEAARSKADRFAEDVQHLQRKVDKLSLGCQALWELLCERAGLKDDDLLAKMEEIDLRDGVQDGKMTQRVVICPSCKRNTSNKRTRCIYCGTALPDPGLFDAV